MQVAVVGAGIIGASVAFGLAQAGCTVLLLDDGCEIGRASRAAGAMLCPFSELDEYAPKIGSDHDTLIPQLLRSRAWYEEVAQYFRDHSKGQLVREGLFLIAHSDHMEFDGPALEQSIALASKHGTGADIVGPSDISGLYSPGVERAAFLKDEASLDATTFLNQLLIYLHDVPKVRIFREAVLFLTQSKSPKAIRIHTAQQAVDADAVVLCAGVEINRILSRSHIDAPGIPPIFGGRGVSLRFGGTSNMNFAIRTPNRGFACGTHLVPLDKSETFGGATNRFMTADLFSHRPYLGEIATLIDALADDLDIHLPDRPLNSIHVGYRPVVLDRLPVAGITANDKIFVATGTWRNGFLLAPILSDIVTQAVCEGRTDKNPFSPDRQIIGYLHPPSQDEIEFIAAALSRTWYRANRYPPRQRYENPLSTDIAETLQEFFLHLEDEASTIPARLWARAPMRENIPSVYEALRRMNHLRLRRK